MSDHKSFVWSYIDRVWNQHDYAAIDEIIRPDYIQHGPNVPPGREGVKAFFRMVETACSKVTFVVEERMAEGDQVLWRGTLQDKHTGPFQGMPSTGKDFRLSAISILRLEDGWRNYGWNRTWPDRWHNCALRSCCLLTPS